ncbi:PQQ-dependent sugar dehydrogenase [Lampropedia aestuarii]|uniref:PQQ-dependent sugar dehydrogenase n=1 Tax=Lampropedia aestuarii TaxID=2562762 RepID=UPI002468B40D|nr:PQQ-dependent sugar dehydrogenase [Lampropedia aestuarii]MDH5859086.1 PQQ-dependent sugar dehydrogenase [Lampropedia aestuarii]
MKMALPKTWSRSAVVSVCLMGANATGFASSAQAGSVSASDAAAQAFESEAIARFAQPWAMAFLPDGKLLVTERAGALKLLDPKTGQSLNVTGLPEVVYGGQGGLGDVVLHPQFANNQRIYISYAEAGERNTAGAAIAQATLVSTAEGAGLQDVRVIWRQVPKVTGRGHYAHRMQFDRDGFLWVSSGERQQFDPAQDMQSNLGKVLKLNDDGSPAVGNPFADQGGVAAQVWSLGHRNPLGMAFDPQGQLWVAEMGPRGGDELNFIVRGENYGYPIVSNGDHYSGKPIPNHDTRPEFKAPAITWTPVVSPSSLVIYTGDLFPDWKGNAFIGGLSSQALVRVALTGESAQEVQRFDMGERIRAVAQGPDGALWLLEDGNQGRLLRLSAPAR